MVDFKGIDDGHEDVDNYLQKIIESTGGSIYWKNKAGVYLGANTYAAKMVGLPTPKDLIGKTDYDLFSKKDADAFRKNDLLVINDCKELTKEESVISPTGDKLIQLSIKRPLHDKKGNIIGIIGNTIDITDRKKVEKLQAEKTIIEQKNSALSILSGSIAHELKNALSTILIYGDLIRMNSKKSKAISPEFTKMEEMAEKISSAVQSGSVSIDVILANINQAGIDKSRFGFYEISATIDQALQEYPFHPSEKKLLSLSNSYNFPYYGDAILTKHVLFNLIKNALFFIKEQRKGQILIETKEAGKYNQLIFRDTAKGIAPDMLSKMFDQFVTGRKGGTGLGLSFCKMVMQSYGGDITCDSKEGEYTEFVLNFPKRKG